MKTQTEKEWVERNMRVDMGGDGGAMPKSKIYY